MKANSLLKNTVFNNSITKCIIILGKGIAIPIISYVYLPIEQYFHPPP